MIARAELPAEYVRWNTEHAAPFGKRDPSAKLVRALFGAARRVGVSKYRFPIPLLRAVGAFGFQANSVTRTVEYPWIAHTCPPEPGSTVIELGAGASGLQFVMAQNGVNVVNVDPMINADENTNWMFDDDEFKRLNRAFGGRVRFVRSFIEDAGLEDNSADYVFCVSVLEHVPPDALPATCDAIRAVLKPGGRFISTIDLFLDVTPFTDKPENRWGTNTDVRRLVELLGMTLEVGEPAELHGYPEFDPGAIASRRDEFFVHNDVLTQCIVLRKDAGAA